MLVKILGLAAVIIDPLFGLAQAVKLLVMPPLKEYFSPIGFPVSVGLQVFDEISFPVYGFDTAYFWRLAASGIYHHGNRG